MMNTQRGKYEMTMNFEIKQYMYKGWRYNLFTYEHWYRSTIMINIKKGKKNMGIHQEKILEKLQWE